MSTKELFGKIAFTNSSMWMPRCCRHQSTGRPCQCFVAESQAHIQNYLAEFNAAQLPIAVPALPARSPGSEEGRSLSPRPLRVALGGSW
eukprot:2154056-Heterocapsa_arctica.AAC.1